MAFISADGYFQHTPPWVKKAMISVKTIIGVVSVSSFASGHEKVAFFTMLAGAVINELSEFIKDGTKPEPKPDQP